MVVLVCVFLIRDGSPHTALTGYAIILVGFFVLPTRVHERYLVQAFAVLALIWAFRWAERIVLAVVVLANAINLHAVLAPGLNVIFPSSRPSDAATVTYQHHGASPDIYGIGGFPVDAGFTRNAAVVYLVIAIHTAALGYLLWRLVRKNSDSKPPISAHRKAKYS